MNGNNNGTSFLAGFLMGALGGVVAGLLLAPKSGKEMRADIAKVSKELGLKVKNEYLEARALMKEKIELLAEAGKKVDREKYMTLVNEVVEELKESGKVASSTAKKVGTLLADDWSEVREALTTEEKTK